MGTTGQSITLANSIIGVGILAMPFCFQQCGVILATLILLIMGLISRLCCYFLLKSALLARRRNFEFLAFHVFGPAGKLAVEVGIIGFLMGTCIAYFVVVGDLGPQIVAKMFNINQSDILRTSIMVLVSLVCVLPLGLLRNVDSLSNVSAATIAFYFCLVMKVITEAASQLMSSEWHSRMETWRPAGVLQCVPIFSMALFCQTQLFEIFESLPTLSLEKMNVVTKNAINICTCVYLTLGVFGYIAFSSHNISGNILMSLSPTMASDVIKLGFVMSLAFSFPLIIFPCRASLYSFLYKKVHSSHHDHIINHSIPETTFRCITIAIIAVALFISLLIPNIELVLGLVGSTIGVLICVVFPAACFVNVTFKNTNERILAKGVLILGLVIMVLGTYANLQAAENKRVDRYEEKYTQERIDKMVEDFFEKRGNKDVYQEPLKSDPMPKDPYKSKLNNIEVIKDSEAQPPNPVPPESQSNEKAPELKEEPIKIFDKNPQANLKESLNKVEQPPDSHPKDVKIRIEEKLSNGDSDQELKVNGDAKQREVDNKPKLTNGESKADPQKPKETKPSNEDKLDIIKQQKLIETIKQHGEEQKELIKEQKEILDEIIKTKKELQQNKNEVDPNEAKKIAVESIKQIANMAIQSLGGVTDKPDPQNDEKAEKLEKLTNNAVQEIAKKAVETIEAIKEIKNPEQQPLPVQNVIQYQPVVPNIQTNGAINNFAAQNPQPNMNVQPQPQVLQNNPQNPSIPIQNVQLNNLQQAQAPINPNKLPQEAVKPQINDKANNPRENIPANNVISPNVETNNIPNKPNQIQVQNINIQPVQNEMNQVNKIENDIKISPNPAKSQIQLNQGENAQANIPNKIAQNIPLPIAVNNMLNNQPKIDKKPLPKQNEENMKNNNEIVNNIENMNGIHRQKREVIDCTQKVTLKPEDKQICDTLVNLNKNSEEILPKVDLNDVGLRKDLPLLDPNEHYIRRSLQSVNNDER